MPKPLDLEELRKCTDCARPMTERGQERLEGVRQFQAHGRCTRCYQTALQAGRLVARPRAEVTDTEIRCMKCGVWKPKEAYKTNLASVSGKMHTCMSCGKLWERYGITSEQYISLFEDQDHKCAICTKLISPFTRDAHVDHDHRCCPGNTVGCGKCIRGVLCRACNVGIGQLKDDPALLRRAAGYLTTKGVNHG
jgi:hypothetical protein